MPERSALGVHTFLTSRPTAFRRHRAATVIWGKKKGQATGWVGVRGPGAVGRQEDAAVRQRQSQSVEMSTSGFRHDLLEAGIYTPDRRHAGGKSRRYAREIQVGDRDADTRAAVPCSLENMACSADAASCRSSCTSSRAAPATSPSTRSLSPSPISTDSSMPSVCSTLSGLRRSAQLPTYYLASIASSQTSACRKASSSAALDRRMSWTPAMTTVPS